MNRRITRAALAALISIGITGAVAAPAGAAAKKYKNCTVMHKTYKHGVGKKGAKDKVSGHTKRVTTFKVSNALYQANKKLDRDHDGIACEKK